MAFFFSLFFFLKKQHGIPHFLNTCRASKYVDLLKHANTIIDDPWVHPLVHTRHLSPFFLPVFHFFQFFPPPFVPLLNHCSQGLKTYLDRHKHSKTITNDLWAHPLVHS